jgi:ABC-type multidrug transport system fused ATPase/permease subunit
MIAPVSPAAYYRAYDSPLDELVAERGVNLPAGRQQQIAVARAILCTPRVLLLDEAFASLSSSSALELHRVVREAFAGCSVLQVWSPSLLKRRPPPVIVWVGQA